MENKNSYFIAGLVFIIAILSGLVFILYMNGARDDYGDEYFVQADELPRGIKKDGAVYFVGVHAGIIKDIYFSDAKDAKVEIRIMVQKGLPIFADSIAQVETAGISGIAFINISRGSGVGFKSQKRIIKMREGGFARLEGSALLVASKLETALTRINAILGDDDKSGLNGFLKEVASEQNAKNISQIITDIKALSTQLRGLDLNATLANIDALSADLRTSTRAFMQLELAIKSRIDRGEFDFKSILSDTSDDFRLALGDFRGVLKELRYALVRLERDPYEFFFKDTSADKNPQIR